MKNSLLYIFVSIFLVSFVFLGVMIKGAKGNPLFYQNTLDTRVGGPYEASNSTSRYALTMSIVEEHSFFLRTPLANFASPDVVDYKGKQLSIFTPGVSFIGIPFYILGKMFGIPELLTYMSVLLFGILNVYLISLLALKFHVKLYASIISGFIFLFATDAFTYAVSFTQHQESTAIILLGCLNSLQEKRTWKSNLLFGVLYGAGALVDMPNVVVLFPPLVYILYKHVHVSAKAKKIVFSIKLHVCGMLLGILPLLLLFGWYNYATTGSYFKLAQFIGRTETATKQAVPTLPAAKTASGPLISLPFKTRVQVDGLYILLLSNERSWLYYSPVVLLGLVGFIIAYQKKIRLEATVLFSSVVLLNIVLYSMFGDPWGGWAFGPRYLIPAAALLCVFIGVAIQRYKKNIPFIIILSVLLGYSVFVNAVGAFTTTSIPPKQEAQHLSVPIPYTYAYNLQLLKKDFSGSLIYNTFFSNTIQSAYFVYGYVVVELGMFAFIYYLLYNYERL